MFVIYQDSVFTVPKKDGCRIEAEVEGSLVRHILIPEYFPEV